LQQLHDALHDVGELLAESYELHKDVLQVSDYRGSVALYVQMRLFSYVLNAREQYSVVLGAEGNTSTSAYDPSFPRVGVVWYM
jgi:hypothetical protein